MLVKGATGTYDITTAHHNKTVRLFYGRDLVGTSAGSSRVSGILSPRNLQLYPIRYDHDLELDIIASNRHFGGRDTRVATECRDTYIWIWVFSLWTRSIACCMAWEIISKLWKYNGKLINIECMWEVYQCNNSYSDIKINIIYLFKVE